MFATRARDYGCCPRLLQRRRRPGRARLRRQLLRARRRGESCRGRFAESLPVVDVDGRLCSSRPRRAPPRAGRHVPRDGRSATRSSQIAYAWRDALRRARPARLRGEERLPRRPGRHLGRHRLGAHRRPRRRRARAGARRTACRCRRRFTSDATRRRRRSARPRSLGVDFREIPIEPIVDAFDAALAPQLRRARRRHDRGEHPGARPRHAADGAVQQVRLARARHGQQVRALGRLRDALRRHGRRLRAAEGRLQDATSGGCRGTSTSAPAAS